MRPPLPVCAQRRLAAPACSACVARGGPAYVQNASWVVLCLGPVLIFTNVCCGAVSFRVPCASVPTRPLRHCVSWLQAAAAAARVRRTDSLVPLRNGC